MKAGEISIEVVFVIVVVVARVQSILINLVFVYKCIFLI